MNRCKLLLIVLGILTVCSCANEKKKITEEGLLTEDEMVNLIVDVHMFDATISTYNSLEKKEIKLTPECYDSLVLSKHDCNDSIFRKSLEYYSLEGKIKDIYEKVIDSLNVIKVKLEQKSK